MFICRLVFSSCCVIVYCLLRNLVTSICFGSKFRFISVVVFGCVQSLSVPECRTDLVSSLVFLLSIFCPFCIVVFSVHFCFKFIFLNSVFAVLWFQVNRRIQTNLKKYWSVNYMHSKIW